MGEIAASPLLWHFLRESVKYLAAVSSDDGGSVRERNGEAGEPLTTDRKGVDIQRDNSSCPRSQPPEIQRCPMTYIDSELDGADALASQPRQRPVRASVVDDEDSR